MIKKRTFRIELTSTDPSITTINLFYAICEGLRGRGLTNEGLGVEEVNVEKEEE